MAIETVMLVQRLLYTTDCGSLPEGAEKRDRNDKYGVKVEIKK